MTVRHHHDEPEPEFGSFFVAILAAMAALLLALALVGNVVLGMRPNGPVVVLVALAFGAAVYVALARP